MTVDGKIFRDYDIRAVVPDQLDEEGIKKIARAIVKLFSPKNVQVGHDMRVSSPSFNKAFINQFLKLGVDVYDLGLISTCMLYFASGKYEKDMAIAISASHNPPEYNGLKIVKKGAVAVGGDSGIYDIKKLVLSGDNLNLKTIKKGKLIKTNILPDYIKHILSFIDVKKMKPFKLVVDTGNGMAGIFMPEIEKNMPWKVERLFYKLDGTFPNHVPSPIEEKNRMDCINKVKETSSFAGLVFDGDGDRVFMIDEKGRTLSGTIMTAIISENLLKKNKNKTILYNAIVGKIVPETVKKFKGNPIRVRVGHTLIKEAMRKNDALFCGEHSGHYYFKDNYYADSAIIAALLVLEECSIKNIKLSTLHDKYRKYFDSGEINFIVDDKDGIINKLEDKYKKEALSNDRLDGISVWYDNWWFNVRPSNTEPLLRLNIEADNNLILEKKTKEIVNYLEGLGAKEKI